MIKKSDPAIKGEARRLRERSRRGQDPFRCVPRDRERTHLRLLIVGHDRMFLVPDRWSASNSTLVVHLGDSIWIQFQF
jgi:hypothetical protein